MKEMLVYLKKKLVTNNVYKKIRIEYFSLFDFFLKMYYNDRKFIKKMEDMLTKDIAERLFDCKTRSDVESIFDTYSVDDLSRRIKLLKIWIKEINQFFSDGHNEPNIKEDYEHQLATFLDGALRLFV